MSKLLIAVGLLVAASSAAAAQGYVNYGSSYSGVPYAYGPGNGLYDYAPGAYSVAPTFGFGYGNWYDYERSNAPGRGNSAESQR